MEAYAMYFIDLILHLDKHLPEIMMAYGHLIYAILFMVVFCETGLVVTPFLPGDSLLFACGALAAAAPEGMDIKIIVPIFLVSAVLGDACNYMIGEHLGVHMIKKSTRPAHFMTSMVIRQFFWPALCRLCVPLPPSLPASAKCTT